ncbi:MAG: S41 family peptidase [Longimicrobiales bacterium]
MKSWNAILSIAAAALVLTLVPAPPLAAQEGEGCREVLIRVIDKIEQEYPGFEEKTADTLRYATFKKSVLERAETTPDSRCLRVLRDYTGYFRDHHIYVASAGAEDRDEDPVAYHTEKIDGPLDQIIARVSRSDDPLEGIWETPGYEVGITARDDGGYAAFIIEADTAYWKPGEIKFRLYDDGRADYSMRDHSRVESTYTVHGGSVLEFEDLSGRFIRTRPEPPLPEAEIEQKLNELDGLYFERLSDRTALLRLARFAYSEVARIEALIDGNRDLLENHENLVLDLRDNPGGTDDAYRLLLPYLYTNPIRVMGAEYKATPTLVNGLQEYMDGLPDTEEHDADRERISGNIRTYKAHMGEFVGLDSTDVYVQTMDPADPAPRQIVILANRGTASAAEHLVYKARQSRKVKIMGTPTAGVLDYGSSRWADIGTDRYRLSIPTFRSTRLPEYPIDNIGLQPDIYLDQSVEDWVEYAQDYMEHDRHD